MIRTKFNVEIISSDGEGDLARKVEDFIASRAKRDPEDTIEIRDISPAFLPGNFPAGGPVDQPTGDSTPLCNPTS